MGGRWGHPRRGRGPCRRSFPSQDVAKLKGVCRGIGGGPRRPLGPLGPLPGRCGSDARLSCREESLHK